MTDDTHCYRETLIIPDGSGDTIETFICGRLGPPCVQCGGVSTVLCDFPIGEEARTCDKPLCERCAPTVGHDKNYCCEHFAAGAGPNMILFTPKPRANTVEENSAIIRAATVKPRLPKAPIASRRWRVVHDNNMTAYAVTGWMSELEARTEQKKRGWSYFVETWDEFVTAFRKRYPLAPRKPRPKK